MAVVVDATGEFWNRTTSLPSRTAVTMMGWFYPTDLSAIHTYLCIGTATSSQYHGAFTSAAGVLTLYNGSATDTGSTLSTNTWYHIALVCDGDTTDNLRCYVNGALDISYDGNVNVTVARMDVGITPDNDFMAGRFAAVKVWDAALTVAEIQNEKLSYRPKRLANLHCWWPGLNAADQVDYSGLGKTPVVGATPTSADGPPVAWA